MTGPQCPSWRGAHCRDVGAKEKAGRSLPSPHGPASSAGGSHHGRPCRLGAGVTREEGVGALEQMCWVPPLLPRSPPSPPRPGTQEPVRRQCGGWCRDRARPRADLGCPGPHLLRGLPDAVTHGLRVALLFLQLLLELRDAGLQAALLILQRVPKGKAAALGPPASPRPRQLSPLEEQCLGVVLFYSRDSERLRDLCKLSLNLCKLTQLGSRELAGVSKARPEMKTSSLLPDITICPVPTRLHPQIGYEKPMTPVTSSADLADMFSLNMRSRKPPLTDCLSSCEPRDPFLPRQLLPSRHAAGQLLGQFVLLQVCLLASPLGRR